MPNQTTARCAFSASFILIVIGAILLATTRGMKSIEDNAKDIFGTANSTSADTGISCYDATIAQKSFNGTYLGSIGFEGSSYTDCQDDYNEWKKAKGATIVGVLLIVFPALVATLFIRSVMPSCASIKGFFSRCKPSANQDSNFVRLDDVPTNPVQSPSPSAASSATV